MSLARLFNGVIDDLNSYELCGLARIEGQRAGVLDIASCCSATVSSGEVNPNGLVAGGDKETVKAALSRCCLQSRSHREGQA